MNPERRTEPANSLGVLFVHGIGDHVEGVPLVEAGEPMLAWLRDWLEPEIQVTVESAVLKPAEAGGASRAHAEVTVRFEDATTQRLVMAESLWAKQFDPPPFRELCPWLLGYGAWMALRQFGARPLALVREVTSSDFVRFFASWLVSIVGALVVVVPLQLFLVVLYVLSALPVSGIAKWLGQLSVKLSDIIGDSYLFVASPLVRAAVTHKFLEDLSSLEERCKTVVVVAHSQGAAVAFDALRQRPTGEPVRLITYGAGIRKLFEIEQESRRQAFAPKLVRLVWVLFLLGVLAGEMVRRDIVHLVNSPMAEIAHAYNPDSHFGLLLLFVLYFISAIAAAASVDREDKVDEQLQPAMKQFLERDVRWLNLYATNDPVSGGSLLQMRGFWWNSIKRRTRRLIARHFSWINLPAHDVEPGEWTEQGPWQTCAALPNFRAAPVVNERSMIADHTAYWRSADDFIVRVITALDEWARMGWLPRKVAKGELIRRLSAARSDRIRLRQFGHFTLFAVAVAMAGALWPLWMPLAVRVDQWPPVRAVLQGVSTFLPVEEATLQTWRVVALGVGAHLLAAWLYLRFVSGPLWRWWDDLFRNRRLAPPGWGLCKDASRLLAWMLSVVVPVWAMMRAVQEQNYRELYYSLRNPVVDSVVALDQGQPGVLKLSLVIASSSLFAFLVHWWTARRSLAWNEALRSDVERS